MKTEPRRIPQEYRYLSEAPELRSASGGAPHGEGQAGEDARTVRGYAALFESKSENLGFGDFYFYEVIARGAFDHLSFEGVVALFNHDQNLPLARYGAGLSLGVDERGLWYEFALPDTTTASDLRALLKAGIISQSSFAFTVEDDGQSWEEIRSNDGKVITTTRTIKRIGALYDVSLVTRPAYADTSVALRALHAHRAEHGQQKLPLSPPVSARALSAEVYALTGLALPALPPRA